MNKKLASFGLFFCVVTFNLALFFPSQTVGNTYYLIIYFIASIFLLYYIFRGKSKSVDERDA
jgi:hypothetical protein